MDPLTGYVTIVGLIAAAKSLRVGKDSLTATEFRKWLENHNFTEEINAILREFPKLDVTIQAIIDDHEDRVLHAIKELKSHFDKHIDYKVPTPLIVQGTSWSSSKERFVNVQLGVRMADVKCVVINASEKWEYKGVALDYLSKDGPFVDIKVYRVKPGLEFPIKLKISMKDAYNVTYEQVVNVNSPPPLQTVRYGFIKRI